MDLSAGTAIREDALSAVAGACCCQCYCCCAAAVAAVAAASTATALAFLRLVTIRAGMTILELTTVSIYAVPGSGKQPS